MAGTMLMERFGHLRRITRKGRGNVVTDVDVAVESAVIAKLSEEFPDVPILGEELSGSAKDGPRADQPGWLWIVDPLDGTRNYASGIPHFSVVIALALDGEVIIGVNHDPVRDELFLAECGKGALMNGQPIAISDKQSLEPAVFGIDLSYDDRGASHTLDVVRALWPGFQTVRIMGSAALGLSWAAAGRLDIFLHDNLEPWDQAAGLLLVEEAGGLRVDRSGKRASLLSDGIIAANAALLRDFLGKTDGHPWRAPTVHLA
jgi:fructose-1,6-bisphosphatase/inositol monophosphatase family enzyme